MKLSEGRHPCWGGTLSLCSHSGVLYTSINKLNRLIGLAGLGQNCFFGLSSMPYLGLVDVCSHLPLGKQLAGIARRIGSLE